MYLFQQPSQPQKPPQKSAAELAAQQAVELAKQQKLYSQNQGQILKQESGKSANMGNFPLIFQIL